MESTNIAVMNMTEVEFLAIQNLLRNKAKLGRKKTAQLHDFFVERANNFSQRKDDYYDDEMTICDDFAAFFAKNETKFCSEKRKYCFTIHYPKNHAPSNLLQPSR